MKPINTNGRRAGQRGGNVVHHLDLRGSTRRRKQLRPVLPVDGFIPEAPASNSSGSSSVRAEGDAEDAAAGDSQARHRIKLLERRLQKMMRLLEDQENHSMGGLVDDGVASIYRVVQGVDARDAQAEDKRALMASIFLQNVKLRERVTFGSSADR